MLSLLLTAFLAARSAVAVDSTLFGDTWNTTEWLWQSAVVVGDQLYVDGGEFYNQADTSLSAVTFYSLASTLRVDLSQSWTNATVAGNWYGQDQFQDVRRPNMWYNKDDNKIYRWGGWPYWTNVSWPSSFWSFDVQTDGSVVWEEAASFQTNGLTADSYAPFGAAVAATDTTFYALGGSNQTYYAPVQGLVTYDYSSGQWNNASSTSATSTGFAVMAQAAYMPNFGDSGFIAYVGGDIPTSISTYGYESGTDLADMSVITLYDIASKTFYHQKATGDIPPPRSEFCMVGTESLDKSSFDMFIYGGSTNQTWDWSNPTDDGYLNVYSLSLPGFVWFKSNDSTPVRRSNHYCQIIGATSANGNSQMLSIGGRQPSSLATLGQAADPWTNGLGVFDMNDFAWVNFYNASRGPYTKPDVISQYYELGNYKKPTFSDPVLAKAFAYTPKPAKASASASATGSGTSSASGTSKPSPSHSSSHTGPIVGGVVGGVAVILIALIAFFVLRRRKNRRNRNAAANHEQYTQNQQHLNEHKAGHLHEAPPYQDGGMHAPQQKYAPHGELHGDSPVTSELAGGQNTFERSTVKRKPLSGSSGPVELPGS